METYFDKFPLVQYGNNTIRDITKKSKIVDIIKSEPYVYYPYVIENSERIDQLSNKMYSDPYVGWITYLSNDIMDPYNEWYSTEIEFNDFLVSKYGSISNASNLILKYVVKQPDDTNLSISDFNSLAPIETKYYQPYYENDIIVHYVKRELDWESSTNAIIKYTTNTSIQNIEANNKVNVTLNGTDFGTGQVCYISNNIIYIQHISGDVYEHDAISLTSGVLYLSSDDQYQINSVEVIKFNISLSEYDYWEPMTAYQYEYNRNEYNRSLRLIDKTYIPKIIKQFKTIMNE